MTLVSKGSLEALAPLGLIAVAGLLTFFAGILILILIPVSLLALVMGFSEAGSAPFLEIMAVLWLPAALVGAFYNAIVGLEVMNDPSWGGVVRLAAVMGAILLTCPLFWLPL